MNMWLAMLSWVVPGWRSMWSRIMYMAPEKP
jgi:hypothetical protein